MTHRLQTRLMLKAFLLSAAVALSAAAGSVQPVDTETAAALRCRADQAERAGQTNVALQAYARLVERDPSCAQPVMLRLVDLYVANGEAAPALAWAARAAERQPAPQAYLAEVHARLGQLKEAELILCAAVREERDARRSVPLFWQLAEIQVRRGDLQAGAATLVSARESAPDDASKAQCDGRLAALRRRADAAARRPVQKKEAP